LLPAGEALEGEFGVEACPLGQDGVVEDGGGGVVAGGGGWVGAGWAAAEEDECPGDVVEDVGEVFGAGQGGGVAGGGVGCRRRLGSLRWRSLLRRGR
jgi:hypothetical protein